MFNPANYNFLFILRTVNPVTIFYYRIFQSFIQLLRHLLEKLNSSVNKIKYTLKFLKCDNVPPQPDAEFIGLLTLQRAGGAIGFKLSEDGTAIAELSYQLEGDVCTDEGVTVTGTGATLKQDPPPAVENGTFSWLSDGVRVEGSFTSPTKAEGTITLAMEKEVQALGQTTRITCDYGTWAWTAEAE
jgi:hypothetical protein